MTKHRLALCALILVAACKSESKPEAKPSEAKPPETKPAELKPAATATKAEAKPAPAAPSAPVVAGGSGVSGVVRFEGKVPEPRKLDMSKDKGCLKGGAKEEIQEVQAKNGLLQGVLVYVSQGLAPGQTYPEAKDKVVLDQQGCLYHPHMLALQTGQPLEIINSDPLLHNVHAYLKGAEFNQAMPKQNQKIEKRFKKPSLMAEVKCEVHPWMQAHVSVFDHPHFAITDEAGSFKLPALPPGKYTLSFAHDVLGEQKQEVVVPASGAAAVSASFAAKP